MNRILATIIFSPLLAAACADKPACAYKSLCDSQADAAATGLFEALDRCASRGVMLGHQDDLSYGVGWVDAGDGRSDVRDVTGDYPSLSAGIWGISNSIRCATSTVCRSMPCGATCSRSIVWAV